MNEPQDKIRLMENSVERMKKAVGKKRDEAWWIFMRRETWLHLERAIELYQALATEEKTAKAPPEILVRLKLRDLDEKANLEEIRYEIDEQEVMIRGYRCIVETFRPE